MNRDAWGPMLHLLLSSLTMALVMGWAARSRLRMRPCAERQTLQHPLSTLVIGSVGASLFFGVALAMNTVGKNSTSAFWVTLLFVGFGLASTLLLLEYSLVQHRLSDQGIEYRRMLGQRGTLRWLEVRRVRFAPALKWFTLELHSGATVRVSAMLMGLPEFARLVVQHVPRELIDPVTVAILEETGQGKPPSLWH